MDRGRRARQSGESSAQYLLRLLGVVVVLIGVLTVLATLLGIRPSVASCTGGQPCQTELPSVLATVGATVGGPTFLPTLSAGPSLTPEPSPTMTYTFADEFDGNKLSSSWGRHYDCCGSPIAGYDESLVSVSDGLLHIRAERRFDGWWVYLVDTKKSFTQLYGKFEARIKVPVGRGFWPAFWGYSKGSDELDFMELCANPPGTYNHIDSTFLYSSIHVEGPHIPAHGTRVTDLSQDFHVYGAEWRKDGVTFYLDGQEIWRWDDVNQALDTPLALLLDLGVGGGTFCGPATAKTPQSGEMLVDWVHVSP